MEPTLKALRRPVPILFLGDAPELPTGLARIGRDLAIRVARMPEFRVGYLGREGTGSRSAPFQQYHYQLTRTQQWAEDVLVNVWEDFAGSEQGIIFTVWDLSRTFWLSSNGPHRTMLEKNLLWGYAAIDGEGMGKGGAMSPILTASAANYDRLLAYTQFGQRVLQTSLSTGLVDIEQQQLQALDWMPHGYDPEIFYLRDAERTDELRRIAGTSDRYVIGCVMSNQERKDWGLAFRIARSVAKKVPNVLFRFWTDDYTRYWDFNALISDAGLNSRNLTTMCTGYSPQSDKHMSAFYATCDLTILPSLGEGFGYPIVESLASGVPVIHGNYAGGAEIIQNKDLLIPASAVRVETRYNVLRPVFHVRDWVDKIVEVSQHRRTDALRPDVLADSVRHLQWPLLWPRWERWFRDGIMEGAGLA
jgi:glycosyltransferase involved in cell wall biosynthesis